MSDNTTDQIAHIADLHIKASYGMATDVEVKGASLIGIGFLAFDMPQAAHQEVREELERRVNEVLKGRLCECTKRTGKPCRCTEYPGVESGIPAAFCTRYYEDDVPDMDGYKLCGTCYCWA